MVCKLKLEFKRVVLFLPNNFLDHTAVIDGFKNRAQVLASCFFNGRCIFYCIRSHISLFNE